MTQYLFPAVSGTAQKIPPPAWALHSNIPVPGHSRYCAANPPVLWFPPLLPEGPVPACRPSSPHVPGSACLFWIPSYFP